LFCSSIENDDINITKNLSPDASKTQVRGRNLLIHTVTPEKEEFNQNQEQQFFTISEK
jgi:hypothetical protein